MAKTNAARILDAASIRYELREYEVDEDDLSAPRVAEKIGMPPEQVFKTLVARGDRSGVLMACIPANTELDLKALAAASGNKKVELVAVKEVLRAHRLHPRRRVTGRRQKPYPFYLDETAILFDVISVSAGIRGCQMMLAPDDLAAHPDAQLLRDRQGLRIWPGRGFPIADLSKFLLLDLYTKSMLLTQTFCAY